MSRKLWEVSDELERVFNSAVDPETGEILEGLASQLDALEGELTAKCFGVAAYICGERFEAELVEAQAEVFRAEADKRTTIAKRHRTRAEWYEQQYLAPRVGSVVGDKPVTRDGVTMGFRKSQAVEIVNPLDLPEKFWRVTRAPAKSEIGAALKAGESVPGTALETRRKFYVK